MSDSNQDLAARLEARFAADVTSCTVACGETTLVITRTKLLDICMALRDETDFAFEILIDLCGVDYAEYGMEEWEQTEHTTYNRIDEGEEDPGVARPKARFAVAYHLLSIANNQRLRLKVFLDEEPPRVDSVVEVWSSANWYEREAFDLFGILFDGHPDLRRLLSDYGFIGHPFRKDFPLIGNVEMRYDPEKRRVVYEPTSINPRILVPRVIRHDSRYEEDASSSAGGKRDV